jgi:outer membrane protein TolC
MRQIRDCSRQVVAIVLLTGLSIAPIAGQTTSAGARRTRPLLASQAGAQAPQPGAQQPPTPAAQPAAASGADTGEYKPPVIRFPAEGITVAEAVRLTMENDPTIKQQMIAVAQQEGVAEEQQGTFDPTVFGKLFYEYRQQELPESRKKTEQDKRDRLQQGVDDNRAAFNRANTLIGQLQAAQSAGPGGPQAAAIGQIDPQIGAQLQILDVLIAAQTNDSVRNQLLATRQQFINSTITDLQGGLGSLVNGFTTGETLLRNLGPTPEDEVFYNGGFSLQLNKQTRWGLFLSPFLDGKVEGTNFKGKPRDENFGGKGLQDLFTFHAGVNVTLPLLRGRGTDAQGAFEKAAKIGVDATRLAAQHQISVSVLRTITAYWNLRGAQNSLAVARQSADLQSKIGQLTQASIDAGELPKVEFARVQATDARARARVQEGERSVHEARVALATAMGVAVDEQADTLPTAREEFPAAVADLTAADVVKLVGSATGQRFDVRSSSMIEDANRVLERQAETDKRMRLDVNDSTWWTALGERSVNTAIDRWVGPSTDVSLNLEKPLGNNAAGGRYAQRQAEVRQQQISTLDLRRQIGLAIIRAARSMQQARLRAEQAQVSVDAYQKTVDADIERFRAGDVTLIDTLLTEQQQVDARLSLVSALQDLATLIAQLRYESGTLLSFTDGRPAFDPADARTVPRAATVPGPAPRQGAQ